MAEEAFAPEIALVIGAGPAGRAAALALQAAGLKVRVHERSVQAAAHGSAVTLWPNGLRALAVLGLNHDVRRFGEHTDGIAVTMSAGRVLDAIPGYVMRERFGGDALVLRRQDLLDALDPARRGIEVRYDHRLLEVSTGSDGAVAVFDDGSSESADLLVGADGIRSVVRRSLKGPERLRAAGSRVWRGIAELELPERTGVTVLGRGAQFGYFPLPGRTTYWFASLNCPPEAPPPPPGVPSEVRDGFAGWHDPIPALLSTTPDRDVVVTDIFDLPPQRSWGHGPVTLAGDAAHPSSPALGQGACQALEDAVVLGRCVRGPGDSCGRLRRYEQARSGRANAMTRQARLMGRMGQLRFIAACRARDWLISQTPDWARSAQLRSMFLCGPD